MKQSTESKKHLFDNPKNVTLMIRLLYGICAVLLVLDFIVHRHVSHTLEGYPAFYPVYGFVGCVILVVIAKWMRNFIMRDEDYYLKHEQAAEQPKAQEQVKGQSTPTNQEQNVKSGGQDADA